MKDIKTMTKKLRELKEDGFNIPQILELWPSFFGPLTESDRGWVCCNFPVMPTHCPTRDRQPKSEAVNDFQQKVAGEANVDLMEAEVKKKKVTEQYERYLDADTKAEKLNSMDFLATDPAQVERLKKLNVESFHSFWNSKAFIGPMFNGVVPFTPKELILILGQTGSAKTTTMANLVWATVKQKNPKTAQQGKVLVISNEESELDILNRIASLARLETQSNDGEQWYYVDRAKFTRDQINFLNCFIEKFKGSGLVTVIDLEYKGEQDFTCYLENVKAILDQATHQPGLYDCIVIDYYQQIRYSLKNPLLDEHKVQKEFAASINSYKEKAGCPIVIMAQINEPSKDKSWKERIVGTKAIAQPCTFIMEVAAKKSTYTTDWIIHKARYANGSYSKVITGFKYGRIVPIDDKFRSWAESEIKAKKIREASQIKRQKKLDQHEEKSGLDALLEDENE